jgi:hypothetical protein
MAVGDVPLGCLGVGAGLAVVTEQETGLCAVEVKLGGVEAEAAGRLAVG